MQFREEPWPPTNLSEWASHEPLWPYPSRDRASYSTYEIAALIASDAPYSFWLGAEG